MKIIDYTEVSRANQQEKDDRSAYEMGREDFRAHYYRCWTSQNSPVKNLPADVLLRRREAILTELKSAERRLDEIGIRTRNLKVVLIVGNDSSNGHAYLGLDGPVAWFALEAYDSQDVIKNFVTHEVLHALHYAADAAYSFSDRKSRLHFGRQVMTEGLACLAVKNLFKTTDKWALWADVIPSEEASCWKNLCRANWELLRAYALSHWNETGEDEQIFYANDRKNIFAFRAGYFIGLKVVEEVARRRGIKWQDVLVMKREILEKECMVVLEKNTVRWEE